MRSSITDQRKLWGRVLVRGIKAILDRKNYDLTPHPPHPLHGRGLERYNLQSETDNVPRLNPESVELWFELAVRVFGEITMCFLLAYNKNAFSCLESNEMQTLRSLLPSEYKEELIRKDIL